jgi:hypothetical protein
MRQSKRKMTRQVGGVLAQSLFRDKPPAPEFRAAPALPVRRLRWILAMQSTQILVA